ncbi:MAG: hypothetical protein KC964_10560 [Candidatus Omnitrophica bacterium]|nr:hypothetical protein [Candidatus Omnitrophota bacterium]MCA9441238.1 hypothetical protein [Candidatus Omnitrophota bacterium]
MPELKSLVCLANSHKMSERCVAGKELGEGTPGRWIRPVSKRRDHELNAKERCYSDGAEPRLMDLIEIPLLEARPYHYQAENQLIDDRRRWRKAGRIDWNYLSRLVDRVDGGLWSNGYSSHHGENDRVPEQLANRFSHSLLLIHCRDLVATVSTEEKMFAELKTIVRIRFQHNREEYCLSVTDPIFRAEHQAKGNGDYPIPEAYLCLSLGDPLGGNCYKLAASVITPGRAA